MLLYYAELGMIGLNRKTRDEGYEKCKTYSHFIETDMNTQALFFRMYCIVECYMGKN
jgi:hypothetical protein